MTAGDRLATQAHLRVFARLESHIFTKLREHLHRSSGFESKAEVVSLVHFSRVQFSVEDFMRKLVWCHQRKIASERKHQYSIKLALVEQPKFLRRGSDELQRRVGP